MYSILQSRGESKWEKYTDRQTICLAPVCIVAECQQPSDTNNTAVLISTNHVAISAEIDQEKDQQQFLKSIETFPTEKLHRANTEEKNPLPTKEVIEAEKQSQV